MNIREAVNEDAESIARVLRGIEDIRSVQSRPLDTTVAIVRTSIAKAHASGSSSVFVSENGDCEVVAYCAVHWVPFLFMQGGEAYVTELFVDTAAAGGGHGSALLDVVVQEAKRRGCSRLSLLNDRDRESYRRGFYEKRGWIERPDMANFVLRL